MKKIPFLLASALVLTGCDLLTQLSNRLGGDDKVAEYIVENAEKWDDAWEDMFFTNFTGNIYMTMPHPINEVETETLNNYLELSDDAILYVIGQNFPTPYEAFYVEKVNDVWSAYRFDDASEKYISYDPVEAQRAESVKEFKDKLASEASLFISFKTYYDKFVFDKEKNEYYCESIIAVDLDDNVYRSIDLAARKSHVKFEKGKIVSISAEYVCYNKEEVSDPALVFEEEAKKGISNRFEFTDINKTVVKRPTNIE